MYRANYGKNLTKYLYSEGKNKPNDRDSKSINKVNHILVHL